MCKTSLILMRVHFFHKIMSKSVFWMSLYSMGEKKASRWHSHKESILHVQNIAQLSKGGPPRDFSVFFTIRVPDGVKRGAKRLLMLHNHI